MGDFPLKIAPGDDLSLTGFTASTEDDWFFSPGFMLDLQCSSSDNWNGEEQNWVSWMQNLQDEVGSKKQLSQSLFQRFLITCLWKWRTSVVFIQKPWVCIEPFILNRSEMSWDRKPSIHLSQAASFAELGQKSILQEVVEAVLRQAAEIPHSGCLGVQNLVAVRLYLSTVLNQLSTVTLGTLATKLFPGPQISNSGVGAGYQCVLLEML